MEVRVAEVPEAGFRGFDPHPLVTTEDKAEVGPRAESLAKVWN